MTGFSEPFDERLAAAIAALAAEEGTPDERVRLEQMVAESPEGAKWLALVQQARREMSVLPTMGDPAAFLARLHDALPSRSDRVADLQRGRDPGATVHLDARTAPRGRTASAAGRHSAPGRAWAARVAIATLSFAAVAATIVFAVRRRAADPLLDAAPTSGTRYATGTGERATITLRDGTHMTLAPRSTAIVAADFGVRRRAVALTGEAYFDVAHTNGTPFVVHTGAVHTRVLGTTFDVRRYADDRDVRIAVTSGKVAVGSSAHRQLSAVLADGVAARVTDSTAVTATIVDPTPYTGWVRGQLDFVDAPLPDVLAALTRWYGYRFHVADSSLTAKRVTARLDYSSTADLFQALETLLSVSATLETPSRTSPPVDTVILLRRRVRASGSAPNRRLPLAPVSTHLEVGR